MFYSLCFSWNRQIGFFQTSSTKALLDIFNQGSFRHPQSKFLHHLLGKLQHPNVATKKKKKKVKWRRKSDERAMRDKQSVYWVLHREGLKEFEVGILEIYL